MKILDRGEWNTNYQETTIEGALLRMASDHSCDSGQLEQIQRDIDALRNLIVAFMSHHITTVDQLNDLAGYQRFIKMLDEK
jgi:hypothetical protein